VNKQGSTTLKGYRSNYPLALGEVPPERLYQWQEEVRTKVADEFLRPWKRGGALPERVSIEDDGMQYVIHGSNKTPFREENVKAMCGKPITEAAVVPSHADYVEAFRRINLKSWDRLQARLRAQADTLPPAARRHENTKHLMRTHPSELACIGDQLQINTKASTHPEWKQSPGCRVKPLHFDGTNSFLQLGSTLFGLRDVYCYAEKPALKSAKDHSLVWPGGEPPTADTVLQNHPGSLYFGLAIHPSARNCGPQRINTTHIDM
jgi:hypothetical protein